MNISRFSKNQGNDESDNEREILRQVQEGDEQAFGLLFTKYHKRVYALAVKIIKSHELAEEILYTVFLKIWEHGALNKIEKFDAYLRILTRNQTLKVWRSLQLEHKRKLYMESGLRLDDHSTEETIAFGEMSRLLEEAVKRLPPQQKTVYRLCHVEGKKYEEVAAHLSLSKLTVKTHMQLALRFIRKYLHAHTEIAVAFLCVRFYFL